VPHHNTHHSTVACIIPPRLLERLARGGNKQRDSALRTLSIDATLRTTRVHNALAGKGRNRTTVLQSVTPGKPSRTIFDCGNKLPASDPKIVRREGSRASKDVTVNEAYDGLGDTYAFYWDQFQRDSIDDQGMPLHGWVHYGEGYDNAFWDGNEMVFGDGDMFDRFTKSLDVIGHELTHGVTEKEAGLQYLNQSGALNESVSDVFGSLIKQYTLGQSAGDADWLIGAGLLAPRVTGVALRSMKEPGTAYDDDVLGKDPQPATMDDYVHTGRDNETSLWISRLDPATQQWSPNSQLALTSKGGPPALAVYNNRLHLVGVNPADHKKFVEAEINKWGPIIKAAGQYAD
jgi:Zn-dependent metalloprotease